MNDSVKQYRELQQALITERGELEQRLNAINVALAGGTPRAVPAPAWGKQASGVPAAKAPVRRKGKRGRKAAAPIAVQTAAKPKGAHPGRGGNPMSLREAALKVTKNRALTKQQILNEIAQIGYRFAAKNPITSLNPLLYKKGLFVNLKGKFRAA